MEAMDASLTFAFLAVGLALYAWKSGRSHDLVQQFLDAIDRFKGGGPGTPMHPSPVGESFLLRRPRRKPGA